MNSKTHRLMQDRDHLNSIEEKLPLTITAVSPQKKSRERFSLFHQDLFLIGVSSHTLIGFSIQKGMQMTPSLFQKLENEEEFQRVKEQCYKYLSRREHAVLELKQKVQKKGYRKELIESVLEELDQKGYLNDELFARKFATDKATLKKWGPIKIKQALRKKGVANVIAEKTVQEIVTSLDQDQICIDLVLKRKSHFLREGDTFKRKQKIYAYLAGKGYPGRIIQKTLPVIIQQLHA